MATTIKATKDLYHEDGTRSFTKGKEYTTDMHYSQQYQLIEAYTTNDQQQRHKIGTWYKNFKIVR